MKVFNLLLMITLLASRLVSAQPDDENKPTKNTYSKLPAGPDVYGVFDGRTPCKEIARELHHAFGPDCFKLKWRIVLYQDATRKAPTHFTIASTFHRTENQKGTWTILHGTTGDPKAIIFRLTPAGDEVPLYLLKGDDNVLFFLDSNKKLLAGNSDFSYTLNRVEN